MLALVLVDVVVVRAMCIGVDHVSVVVIDMVAVIVVGIARIIDVAVVLIVLWMLLL